MTTTANENRAQMVLTTIHLAARDTNLYTFARVDGGALPPARAGAHLGVCLPNGMERHYSLINPDDSPRSYTVGVKKDVNGRGGSAWIHDNLRVGMTLPVDLPRNNFPLKEDAPHTVLFAGGIGITPIYAMTRRLLQIGRPFDLYYSCRSRADMAFLDELKDAPGVYLHFNDESDQPFLPIRDIISAAPDGTHFYCCGPAPMLSAFETTGAAAGRNADEIHVEYFVQKFAAASEGGYVVELARTGRIFEIPQGKSILKVLLEAGLDISHSCEEGVCGTCETRVLSGVPDHRDALLSEVEKASNKTMMICCSGAKSKKLILDL